MALWAPYSRLGSDEKDDKPLPSLPSPTLTNPDLVLPDEPFSQTLPSPARTVRQAPNISYLHVQPNDPASLNRQSLNVEQHLLDGYHGPTNTSSTASQRSGSGTRKLLLGRQDSGDGSTSDTVRSRTPTSIDHNASSPMDKNRLGVSPQGPVRRPSGSSMSSEEMAKMPEFLNKYRHMDTTDEEDVTDIEGGAAAETRAYDEQRKAKQEEEQMSLLLSQRAEEILANAKKRLNLMEGNLRGARDLVAPLTAANLKRATSLSSAFGSPSMAYTHRRLDSMAYDSDPYQPRRTLYSQASSPAMRTDYYTHARVSSETELIERPYTAFSSRSGYINRSPRFPVKPSEAFMAASTSSPVANTSAALRPSRSYDSFGLNRINTNATQHPQQATRESPISSLEPVSEDEHKYLIHPRSRTAFQANNLDVPRGAPSISGSSATASEDLRDQMESLKGRISNLKERAREDSLRRSSQNNLREPSPLNNASHAAPEFWYTQPSNYGIPSNDARAVSPIDRTRDDSPTAPHFNRGSTQNFSGPISSRNAFAERATRDEGLAAQSSASGGSSPIDKRQSHFSNGARDSRRGSSGTAILAGSKNPSSGHQSSRSREMPGAFDKGQFDSSDEYESDMVSDGTSLMPNSEPSTPEPNGPDDEDLSDEFDFEQASIYEDAEHEQPEFIAHEDREDAFDYEHFFLHSAMGSYSSGRDSPSDSETSSVSSADTARAPQYEHDDLVEYDDELDEEEEDDLEQVEEIIGEVVDDQSYEPQARGTTPDALRQIEARLQQVHGRSMSTESLDTINTFATATEGRDTPSIISRSASRADEPVTPTEATRPSTAVRTDVAAAPAFAKPAAVTAVEGDDASDRADSGVGGLSQANSQGTPRSIAGPDSDVVARSPPASPARTAISQHRRMSSRQEKLRQSDSIAAAAIRSLLEPTGKPLDDKDESIVRGLVESLRNVCIRLQKEQQAQQTGAPDGERTIDEVVERSSHYEGQILRKRLEDARRVLDGLGVRKDSSTPTSPVPQEESSQHS